ncbi:hypothetical protein [Nocardiopsis alba]|uniref:hypothetical protein n=1 Tax=Nocardiopsis alba TaxID=53437 RepID=UPI0019D3CF02|nr:hypothetical protein [Nocardiopsis alba]
MTEPVSSWLHLDVIGSPGSSATTGREGGALNRRRSLSSFAIEHKSCPEYLDIAANTHGEEKGFFVLRALEQTRARRPHVVEIGPGGGAAVKFLASSLSEEHRGIAPVDLTLVEVPGVASSSLSRAMSEFNEVGNCELAHGFAQDLNKLLPRRADVVSASALVHEIYSYGGGYSGLQSLIRVLGSVIVPYGYFVYRDVYSVQGRNLHDRVMHTCDAPSWLRFIRMFTPNYLERGRHPYHNIHDQVMVRQNSCQVDMADLQVGTCAVISAPVGLFREIQRHYITFRDHVWRSGALGFTPVLDGELSMKWLDMRAGHKLVHYVLASTEWLPKKFQGMMDALSESNSEYRTVDGDVFDTCTDLALNSFLAAVEEGDDECSRVWEEWSAREGRETYAYLTVDELLTEFAVHSTRSSSTRPTILIPSGGEDIVVRQRHYYNRYLTRKLSNPLWDAKQLVLFRNIPVSDSLALSEALACTRESFSNHNLARVYAALAHEGG